MATKISEVIESLLEIQKIHGDLPVLALSDLDVWEEAKVREGRFGEAIVAKIEGLR